jgi:hypothetical protein
MWPSQPRRAGLPSRPAEPAQRAVAPPEPRSSVPAPAGLAQRAGPTCGQACFARRSRLLVCGPAQPGTALATATKRRDLDVIAFLPLVRFLCFAQTKIGGGSRDTQRARGDSLCPLCQPCVPSRNPSPTRQSHALA